MSGSSSGYDFRYTIGPPPTRTHRLSTSRTELTHLAIAFVVLTLDFVLLFRSLVVGTSSLLILIAVAGAAALSGFICHEMAHKISAQRRGYWAEFRMSPIGLLISVVTAAIGFLFAAPGATMIGGMASLRDWGLTSLAGPATNCGFALVFLSAAFLTGSIPGSEVAASSLLFLAYINAWFAAFNMIPLGPLDGAKVLRWNRGVWAACFAGFAVLAGILFFIV